MRVYHPREVQNKKRPLMPWIVIFALLVLMISGQVRLYETEKRCSALQETCYQVYAELEELKKQTRQAENALGREAEELGLHLISPEEITVIHVPADAEDSAR